MWTTLLGQNFSCRQGTWSDLESNFQIKCYSHSWSLGKIYFNLLFTCLIIHCSIACWIKEVLWFLNLPIISRSKVNVKVKSFQMLLVLKLYIKAGPLRWFYLAVSSTLKRFLILITIRTWKLVDGFVSDTEKFSNILANYLNSGTCAQFLNIIACKYTRYLKHLLIFFKKWS